MTEKVTVFRDGGGTAWRGGGSPEMLYSCWHVDMYPCLIQGTWVIYLVKSPDSLPD